MKNLIVKVCLHSSRKKVPSFWRLFFYSKNWWRNHSNFVLIYRKKSGTFGKNWRQIFESSPMFGLWPSFWRKIPSKEALQLERPCLFERRTFVVRLLLHFDHWNRQSWQKTWKWEKGRRREDEKNLQVWRGWMWIQIKVFNRFEKT